jgi:hypothetical protein
MSDTESSNMTQHKMNVTSFTTRSNYAHHVSLGFFGFLYAYCHSPKDGCIGSVTGVGGFPTGCHEQPSTRQPYPVLAALSSKKHFLPALPPACPWQSMIQGFHIGQIFRLFTQATSPANAIPGYLQ